MQIRQENKNYHDSQPHPLHPYRPLLSGLTCHQSLQAQRDGGPAGGLGIYRIWGIGGLCAMQFDAHHPGGVLYNPR